MRRITERLYNPKFKNFSHNENEQLITYNRERSKCIIKCRENLRARMQICLYLGRRPCYPRIYTSNCRITLFKVHNLQKVSLSHENSESGSVVRAILRSTRAAANWTQGHTHTDSPVVDYFQELTACKISELNFVTVYACNSLPPTS